MSIYRIFAALRRIVADSREYEREINRSMHEMVVNHFVQPLHSKMLDEPDRNKARLMTSLAEDLETESRRYDYSASPRKYLLAKFRSDRHLEEVLSDVYAFLLLGKGNSKAALRYIPTKILSKKPLEDVSFNDIKTLWLVMSRSAVVDTMKRITNPRHQEFIEDSMSDAQRLQRRDDVEVLEEVMEEELRDLYQFISSKAKGPQEKKDAIQLLDTFIKRVGLNYSGNKAFVEAFKKLPANANNRDNERYWRNIWDRTRNSMCEFFRGVFRQKGERMTERMNKLMCEKGRKISRIAVAVLDSELRLVLARWMLGRTAVLYGFFDCQHPIEYPI